MVRVDQKRVSAFSEYLRRAGDVQPFDFCTASEGVVFPNRNRRGVVDYFFFCTAHQFGFWYLKDGCYDRPASGRVDGIEHKGSDFLSRCATRAWLNDEGFFAPDSLAKRSDTELSAVFSDDQGKNPLPMWEAHLDIARRYVEWFRARKTSPEAILNEANRSAAPLTAFLDRCADMPGYGEDPLRKKLMLLAVILENRPERFLRVTDPEAFMPIIDYHLQRSALRTGLVRVDDPSLREKLAARREVTADEEKAVRDATFEAVRQLVRDSGRSVAAVDYFFFTNRRRCPEMTEPECAKCPVQPICARETRLFQPVLRTTYY